jgi:hypothetical protein
MNNALKRIADSPRRASMLRQRQRRAPTQSFPASLVLSSLSNPLALLRGIGQLTNDRLTNALVGDQLNMLTAGLSRVIPERPRRAWMCACCPARSGRFVAVRRVNATIRSKHPELAASIAR